PLILHGNDDRHPSLAPNASRRGHPFYSTRKRQPPPLPRSKRESEGLYIWVYMKTMTDTPPSLQTRVGGVTPFSLRGNDHPRPSLAPNASRRGQPFSFTRKRRRGPLPRSKRESEGYAFSFT